MPFDGSGNYQPPVAPTFPAVTGTVISSGYYNSVINDISTALNNCVTRDGQGHPTANMVWPNNVGVEFTDTNGSNPQFYVDASNILRLYGTNATGGQISIFRCSMRNSSPQLNFDVPIGVAGIIQNTTVTSVSGLPSAGLVPYSRTFVNDANVVAAGNFGAIVAGGGTNHVPVYSDGTNWRIG